MGKKSETVDTSIVGICGSFVKHYRAKTSTRVKVVDSYIAFCFATAAVLYIYTQVNGFFPFNAFLAAFFTCVGGGVLAVCLRLHLDTRDPDPTMKQLPAERACADFMFAHIVLLYIAWNYIG